MPYTFIGYSLFHKGYKCLSSYSRLFVSKNVVFDETSFPYSSKVELCFVIKSTEKLSKTYLSVIAKPTSVLPISNRCISLNLPISHVLSSCDNAPSSDTSPTTPNSFIHLHLDVANSFVPSNQSLTTLPPILDSSIHLQLDVSNYFVPRNQSLNASPYTLPIYPLNVSQLSTYSMIARAKDGISRPKAYSTSLDDIIEPVLVKETLKHPE